MVKWLWYRVGLFVEFERFTGKALKVLLSYHQKQKKKKKLFPDFLTF